MSRLITVSIACRNETVGQTFEEVCSRRRDYLVTKGQGTGVTDVLLLELDEMRPQQTFQQIRSLLSASPNLEVFLTASRTDPQILLEAFRNGVKEFLPQPLTRQDVEPALARFEERFKARVSDAEQQSGKVVCVIGARGGVGASTVATNLATSVQRGTERGAVALMDLDLHGGDLGLFLDLQPSQGLKQLSMDISRLDETILRSSLAQHSSGLHLLTSGHEGFEDAKQVPGSTMRVIGLLRSLHQHVFVDCGHVLEPSVKEALDCADQIVVITAMSLPTIRRTKRLLEAFHPAHYPAGKIVVVVNRYTSDQQDVLREAEAMLGIHMAGLIPNDYGAASEAIDHGNPLTIMASTTTVGQWYLRGTDQLIGRKTADKGIAKQAAGKKASFWGRCLPSFGLDPRS